MITRALPSQTVIDKAIQLTENALLMANYQSAEEISRLAIEEVLSKSLLLNEKTTAQVLFARAKTVISKWQQEDGVPDAFPCVSDPTIDRIHDIEIELLSIVESIPLLGSPKQILWAEKIRRDCMGWVAMELRKSGVSTRDRAPLLSSPPYTYAKTWIEVRNDLTMVADVIASNQKIRL